MDGSVSVVLPVYNGAAFLAQALASIARQSCAPDELIVVDDGSTDGSAQIAQAFAREGGLRVEYIYQANAGPAAARNRGIRAAHGALLAFLDADDLWAPDKQQKQLACFAANPQVRVLMGLTQPADAGGRADSSHGARVYPHFQGALIERRVFETVGWLDENLLFGEDLDWFLRAWEAGVALHTHAEIVTLYRRHPGNLTARRAATRHHLLLALKRSLDRRRQHPELEPPPFLLALEEND